MVNFLIVDERKIYLLFVFLILCFGCSTKISRTIEENPLANNRFYLSHKKLKSANGNLENLYAGWLAPYDNQAGIIELSDPVDETIRAIEDGFYRYCYSKVGNPYTRNAFISLHFSCFDDLKNFLGGMTVEVLNPNQIKTSLL